jgi:hypothetical protein
MADFIPPAPNTASPFADMRGHHVAIRNPDVEPVKRWYVEKLDFRVVAEYGAPWYRAPASSFSLGCCRRASGPARVQDL